MNHFDSIKEKKKFILDAPPNSWMDSTTNPKVKTAEGKEVGARSLARNTLRVEGHVKALG